MISVCYGKHIQNSAVTVITQNDRKSKIDPGLPGFALNEQGPKLTILPGSEIKSEIVIPSRNWGKRAISKEER